MARKMRWKKQEMDILVQEYKKGTSVTNIAKIINRSYHSTSKKAYRIGLKHPYYISTFRPIPSPELGYILGAWLGDRKSKVHLSLVAKDLDFIEKFENCLSKVLGIMPKVRKVGNLYYVQRRDRKFTEWIVNMNLDDLVEFIKKGGAPTICKFVQGFFDAEGTVVGYYTQVTQSNKNILEKIKELFNTLNIKSSIWQARKINYIYYVLRVSNTLSIIKFYNQIGFSIKRKNDKLKNIIETIVMKRLNTTLQYFEFIKLRDSGKSLYEISRILPVSTQTVYNWAHNDFPRLIKNGVNEKDLLDLRINLVG